MGYDLTWSDDNHEDARSALISAIGDALRDHDAVDPETPTSTTYRAMETVGGYFRASDALMRALIVEMETQDMFEQNQSMRDKLERQSGRIKPAEIDLALARIARWPISPREPHPAVIVTEIDKVMAAASLEDRDAVVRGGAEAMMQIHPLSWAREWLRRIVFLFEARQHGGIRVA